MDDLSVNFCMILYFEAWYTMNRQQVRRRERQPALAQAGLCSSFMKGYASPIYFTVSMH
jgi:hypothetical protein